MECSTEELNRKRYVLWLICLDRRPTDLDRCRDPRAQHSPLRPRRRSGLQREQCTQLLPSHRIPHSLGCANIIPSRRYSSNSCVDDPC